MDPMIVVGNDSFLSRFIALATVAASCSIAGRLGTSRGAIFGGTHDAAKNCVSQPPRPSIGVHLASLEPGGRDAEYSERSKHTDQAYPPARINGMTLGV